MTRAVRGDGQGLEEEEEEWEIKRSRAVSWVGTAPARLRGDRVCLACPLTLGWKFTVRGGLVQRMCLENPSGLLGLHRLGSPSSWTFEVQAQRSFPFSS